MREKRDTYRFQRSVVRQLHAAARNRSLPNTTHAATAVWTQSDVNRALQTVLFNEESVRDVANLSLSLCLSLY